MLTPQDVKTKEFTKAVFGGYDMSTVDEFLEALSGDYEALYKENAILKNKLKVLVEKVEEYRSTEDAMRMALLTAQKMSQEIVDKANAKSQSLISDAEKNARAHVEHLQDEVRAEEQRLEEAKKRTAAYVEQARALLTGQLELLGHLDEISPVSDGAGDAAPAAAAAQPAPEPAAQPSEAQPEAPVPEGEASVTPASSEDKIDETAKNIEDSLSRIFEEDISSERAKMAVKPERSSGGTGSVTARLPRIDDVDEPTSPHPKFDFSNLQFGEKYERSEKKKK